MSQFYARIKGNRGKATRQGTKKSGIYAHISGWDIGIEVEGFIDEDGKDRFIIRKTGGSNNPARKKHIVTIRT